VEGGGGRGGGGGWGGAGEGVGGKKLKDPRKCSMCSGTGHDIRKCPLKIQLKDDVTEAIYDESIPASIDFGQQTREEILKSFVRELEENKTPIDDITLTNSAIGGGGGKGGVDGGWGRGFTYTDIAFSAILDPIELSVERVLLTMQKESKSNILVVGRNGIGKSWIINLILLLTQLLPLAYTKITAPDSWKPFQEALHYVQEILCYDEKLKYDTMLNKIEYIRPSKHTHRIISAGSDGSDEMEEDREDREVPPSPFMGKPEMIMPLEGLCENPHDKLDYKTFEPYFLPSQNSGGSTTPCLINVQHGPWSFLMYWKDIETIRVSQVTLSRTGPCHERGFVVHVNVTVF